MTTECDCKEIGYKSCRCDDKTAISSSAVMPGYDKAQAELRRLLVDAKKNRLDADPKEIDSKWDGYLQGIEGAIYRLEMHSVS